MGELMSFAGCGQTKGYPVEGRKMDLGIMLSSICDVYINLTIYHPSISLLSLSIYVSIYTSIYLPTPPPDMKQEVGYWERDGVIECGNRRRYRHRY